MLFGDGMKTERKKQGLSQKRLEEISGVPQSTISAVEAGSRHPSEDTMLMIAKGLNTTVGKLLGEVSSSDGFNSGAALSNEELELITAFRKLNKSMQGHYLEVIKAMANSPTAQEEAIRNREIS